MSRAPKEHKDPAIGTSPSKPAPKTWSSILNTEPIEKPVNDDDDDVVVEKSEEKPLQKRLQQRNFTSTTPGSRFLTNPGSRLPHLTPTIVLDDCSEAGGNSCSARQNAPASGRPPAAADLSSSESDDDENESHPQSVAVSSLRRSPRIRKKKLCRVSSSLSLDSSDSEAPVSPPTRAKRPVGRPRGTTQPRQMGTNQEMAVRSAREASAGAHAQRPHLSEPSSKKQKPNSPLPRSRVGHKDVPSRATALLLQQQQDTRVNKAYGVGAPKTFVGKCLLCNTHGALLTESSICRVNCRGTSAPGPSSANGPIISSANGGSKPPTDNFPVPNRTNRNSTPAVSTPRTAVPVSESASAIPQRSGSQGNVLGKRVLNGPATPCPPQTVQSPTTAPQPVKKIPVINLADVGKNDAVGRDRLQFFSYRPKRFDFPRASAMAKFSPFAATAEGMGNGISSRDVCAACGSGGNLIPCRRCPLAFHKHCHVPPIKNNAARGFFCRACKTVKGDDTSSAYIPAVRLKPRPPPWQPLARLAADAGDGNSMDLVLHPSLHKEFVRLYKTDWLRCCRCKKIRTVGQRSLSDYVRLNFECRDAFWATPKLSCDTVSELEKKQLQHTIAKIQQRSRRRLRLFYHDFGEDDRTSYGFFSTDEVVVLDDDDDTPPPRQSDKRTDSAPGKTATPAANARAHQAVPLAQSTGIRNVQVGVSNGVPRGNAPTVSASEPVVQTTPPVPATIPFQATAPVQLTTPVQSSSSDARAVPPASMTLRPAVQAGSSPSLPTASVGHPNGPTRVNPTLPGTSCGGDILTAPSRTPASEALASRQFATPAASVPVPQRTSIAMQHQRPPPMSTAASHASMPSNFSHSTHTGMLSPASHVQAAPHSNLVQSTGLASSPPTASGRTGTGSATPLINVASPVQHGSGIAVPVQSGNLQGQHQGALFMPDANLTGLQQSTVHQAMSTALQNSALNIARVAQGQHMINTQNTRASEPGPSSVYAAPLNDMRQASTGISAPTTSYAGPQVQKMRGAREDAGWSGNGPPAAANTQAQQQLLLKRIALLGESGEIEDVLVDLALANSPKLIQIFNAFNGNPSRFARQAARLARSTMNAVPAPENAVTPTWGDQANANGTQFSMLRQQVDMVNGAAAPINAHEMQAFGTPADALGHLRALSPAEKHQLNEEFRRVRLMQMDQSIRLETVMVREMKSVATMTIPQLHASHVRAKKRMYAGHADQLRNLLYSVQGLRQPTYPPQ